MKSFLEYINEYTLPDKMAPGHRRPKTGDLDQSTDAAELASTKDKRTTYQGRVSADQIDRTDEVENFAAQSHNDGVAGN